MNVSAVPERMARLRGMMSPHALMPADYPRSRGANLERAGIVCLLLVVFLTPWARDWARVFEVFLVIATIMSARQILRHDPDAWVYAGMALFVLWTLWVNHLATVAWPEWEGDKLEGTRDGARLFIFALCGWWLGGRPRSVAVIACVAICGVLVTAAIPALGLPWGDASGGWPDAFGFRNSQHAAIVYGTILLAVIVLGPRFCGAPRANPVIRWAIFVVAIVGCLWILSQTGNRQIWLGLISGLGVAGLMMLRRAWVHDSGKRPSGRRKGAAWIVVLLGVAAMVWSAGPAWERLQRELTQVSDYMTGAVELPERNSAMIRLQLWKHALAAISERPLLGYGGANRQHVLPATGLPEPLKHWGHAHNSYLDMAMEYGIVAPLVFVLILSGLALRVFQAWRHGFLPTDGAALLLGWIALFAVVNLFETYVYYDTGLFLMAVMGGVCYTATIPYRRSQRGKHPVAESRPG